MRRRDIIRIMKFLERFRQKKKEEQPKEEIPPGFEFNPELDSILQELSKAYSVQSGIYLDGYSEGEDKEEYNRVTNKVNEFESDESLRNKVGSYLKPYRDLYVERGWEEKYLQGGWSPAYIPDHISHMLRILESFRRKEK